MSLDIVTVPCLSDNYAYLLKDSETGTTAVVDAPDAAAIKAALESRGWGLDLVLITHHHDDHINGVDALRSSFGAKTVGAKADAHRLPALDEAVEEGDTVALGNAEGVVIDVSGHTVGHIAFHFADDDAVFTADSLMALGCGRLFEGTADQMWTSLSKLAALPSETEIYSGHEYTAANARFALSVDGDNPDLKARASDIEAKRSMGTPTVPSSLALEKATNPFLRASDPELKRSLGFDNLSDAESFAEIRRRKDRF